MTLVFYGFSFILHVARYQFIKLPLQIFNTKSILLLTAPWLASTASCNLLV